MDNCSAHKGKWVAGALKKAGIVCLEAPPKSPDMNPIEQVWQWLRKWITDNRDPYPDKVEGLQEAWFAAWEALPLTEINRIMERAPEVCQKVNDHDGRNDFHD